MINSNFPPFIMTPSPTEDGSTPSQPSPGLRKSPRSGDLSFLIARISDDLSQVTDSLSKLQVTNTNKDNSRKILRLDPKVGLYLEDPRKKDPARSTSPVSDQITGKRPTDQEAYNPDSKKTIF